MTNNENSSVEYVEPLSIVVGRFLREKGFALASDCGCALDCLGDRADLGILYPKQQFMFSSRKHIGTIVFDDAMTSVAAGAGRVVYKNAWLLRVIGIENVKRVTALANELSAAFNAHIVIRLVSEETLYEDSGDCE